MDEETTIVDLLREEEKRGTLKSNFTGVLRFAKHLYFSS